MNNYDPDRPEAALFVGGELRLSAVEFLRRYRGNTDKLFAHELGSHAQTMIRLGQMAAAIAKGRGLDQVKLYHPTFEDGVNGWPSYIWLHAYSRFTSRYRTEWIPAPQPTILDWSLKNYYQDQRWQTANAEITKLREPNETAEQAFARRQRAVLDMFLVEKEYSG